MATRDYLKESIKTWRFYYVVSAIVLFYGMYLGVSNYRTQESSMVIGGLVIVFIVGSMISLYLIQKKINKIGDAFLEL
ncbi:MAG: hypothetical protein L3J43_07045 [Sulfurovum sp.]|nr:hypothetical protein [Sulfurovum sp.]